MNRTTAVETWREVCGSETVMAMMPPTGRMLEEFARRIASAEREACAEVCLARAKAVRETISTANPRTSEHIMLRRDARAEEADKCGAEIMERSNAGIEATSRLYREGRLE